MQTYINYTDKLTNSIGEIKPIEEVVRIIAKPNEYILNTILKVRNGNKDIKSSLPAFWCGDYKDNKRKNENLISTDMMIFDFDKIDEDKLKDWKDRIITKLKPLLCFISPSGNGLKVIIKLESSIKNCDDFKSTYDYYKEKFNKKGLKADNTSDPVRLCFLSYDIDCYYNPDCLLYPLIEKEVEIEKPKKQYKNDIKWTDDDRVVVDLITVIQQKGRPDYLEWKKILFALTDKVGKSKAIELMQQYFPEEKSGEYEKAFNNPLKNIHFGSLFYIAGIEAKEYYRDKLTQKGRKFDFIKYSENKTEKEAEKENIIWHRQTKRGTDVQYTELKKYLSSIGYYSYIVNQSDTGKIKYGIVKKHDNILQFVDHKEVARDVQARLEETNEQWAKDILEIINNPKDKIFTSEYLAGLKTISDDIHTDTERKSYIYYVNCFIEITKDNVIKKEYKDLDKPIWRKSIVSVNPNSKTIKERKQRHFDIISQDDIEIYKHLDFYQFVRNINNNDNKAVLRFETAIGFLLHRHKNPDHNKAIILHDRVYSDNANGRTGKSLSASCLQFIRNVAEQSGEKFNQDSAFRFDKINQDTEVYFLNDADETLKFRVFYNAVSNSWDIEKKGQSSISIPFEKSPKIIITTNFAVGDTNDSDIARKMEIGLHKHYRADFHPSDEFGRRFFDHYDDIDWLMFDYYMIHCIQMYLTHGLYNFEESEEEDTRLIHRIGKEFYDFCEDFFIRDTGKFGNTEAKNLYCNSIGINPNGFSNSDFLDRIRKYCEFKKIYLKDKQKTNDGANATSWAKQNLI